MRLFWITLLVILFFGKEEEPMRPNHFAYGRQIQTNEEGALFSLTIPDYVYQSVTRPDLGDLRVFNGSENAVPHSLRRSEQQLTQRLEDRDLPFFPLDEKLVQTPATLSLEVITKTDGSIVRLQNRSGGAFKNVRSFLIDCSGLLQSPEALLLSWPENTEGFVLNAKVLYGSDLAHWKTLVEETSLSNLHYGNHTLIQQQIDLPFHHAKYLRIDLPVGSSMSLSSITARFPETKLETPRESVTIPARSFDAGNRTYMFDTHAYYPADRLQVNLPQRNTLAGVRISATNDTLGAWHERFSGLVYDLRIDGTHLQQNAIRFSPIAYRYWRITLAEKDASFGQGMPELRIHWLPNQLVFVAQGDGPFILAYGSVAAAAAETPLEKLLHGGTLSSNSDLIKAAHLGEAITLGGPSALVLTREFNWRTWLLWSILGVSVLLLGWMAVRLFRQMNSSV